MDIFFTLVSVELCQIDDALFEVSCDNRRKLVHKDTDRLDFRIQIAPQRHGMFFCNLSAAFCKDKADIFGLQLIHRIDVFQPCEPADFDSGLFFHNV